METIKIGKTEFPFDVTDELKELVKEANIKLEHIGTAKNETRRFAFLAAKAASEKAGTGFGFTFENFINLVDPEVTEKAAELAKQLTATEATKKASTKKKSKAKDSNAATTDEPASDETGASGE